MRYLIPILIALCLVPALSAQQPEVVDAQFSTASAERGLAAQVAEVQHTAKPAWVGYQIVVNHPFHSGADPTHIAYLEQPQHYDQYAYKHDASYDKLNILLRVADGQIEQLRLENPGRKLDAGGLQFVWLTAVHQEDSLQLLEALARDSSAQHVRENAVFFISLHSSPKATSVLVQLASAGQDPKLRDKAAFWLASNRGHDGFLAIQKLAQQNVDAPFRVKLTFDLTLCREPAATEELIRLARSDPSPQVRRQAQFWMATIAGNQVADELRSETTRNPDETIRASAVFALSQLPEEQAATQLMRVAQTSRDPQVRKQAIFWLGQSNDPRAFEYLAKIIRSKPREAP